MSVGAEMLCDGESRRTLIDALIDLVLGNLERVLFFSVHIQLDTCGLCFWFNQSERYLRTKDKPVKIENYEL